jgi:hypothetical protein
VHLGSLQLDGRLDHVTSGRRVNLQSPQQLRDLLRG